MMDLQKRRIVEKFYARYSMPMTMHNQFSIEVTGDGQWAPGDQAIRGDAKWWRNGCIIANMIYYCCIRTYALSCRHTHTQTLFNVQCTLIRKITFRASLDSQVIASTGKLISTLNVWNKHTKYAYGFIELYKKRGYSYIKAGHVHCTHTNSLTIILMGRKVRATR